MFEANAHTTQTNSVKWAKAHAWHNCVDGGEVGFGVNSKHLQVQVRTSVLIMCSPYTWGKIKANKPKKDETTCQNKLGRIGMIGE